MSQQLFVLCRNSGGAHALTPLPARRYLWVDWAERSATRGHGISFDYNGTCCERETDGSNSPALAAAIARTLILSTPTQLETRTAPRPPQRAGDRPGGVPGSSLGGWRVLVRGAGRSGLHLHRHG